MADSKLISGILFLILSALCYLAIKIMIRLGDIEAGIKINKQEWVNETCQTINSRFNKILRYYPPLYTDEEKFILAKENHERIYYDLVPKWDLIKNHPIETNAPPGGAIQGYIITQSPSMRFYKIYYKNHPHNIGVDLKGFVELKRMVTFEEVKDE